MIVCAIVTRYDIKGRGTKKKRIINDRQKKMKMTIKIV